MTGHVYFIKPIGIPGPVKIGHSSVPLIRLAQIEVWSPLPLEIIGVVAGDLRMEGGLHALLREHHSHGEWFRPTKPVLSTIDCILSGRFDWTTLPPPVDIRSKAGRRDGGLGHLASILTRAINRQKELGRNIPANVLDAAAAFSGPVYERRVQGRDIGQARVVVDYLETIGKKSPAIGAMFAKLDNR